MLLGGPERVKVKRCFKLDVCKAKFSPLFRVSYLAPLEAGRSNPDLTRSEARIPGPTGLAVVHQRPVAKEPPVEWADPGALPMARSSSVAVEVETTWEAEKAADKKSNCARSGRRNT